MGETHCFPSRLELNTNRLWTWMCPQLVWKHLLGKKPGASCECSPTPCQPTRKASGFPGEQWNWQQKDLQKLHPSFVWSHSGIKPREVNFLRGAETGGSLGISVQTVQARQQSPASMQDLVSHLRKKVRWRLIKTWCWPLTLYMHRHVYTCEHICTSHTYTLHEEWTEGHHTLHNVTTSQRVTQVFFFNYSEKVF